MVIVTKSWLKNNIVDGYIDNTDQCYIYRKDRSDRLGGGVLALVSKSYCSYEIAIPVPEKFRKLEIIVHTVLLSVRKYRFISVIDKTPEFNLAGRKNMKLLCECLDFVCRNIVDDAIILVGDFNLPNINWSDLEAANDNIHDVFLDFCVQRGVHGHISATP